MTVSDDSGSFVEIAPWHWQALDALGAAQTWTALAVFVIFLVTRYDLGDVVPRCWWTHGALVEELTALWAAWTAAYVDTARERGRADPLARAIRRLPRPHCRMGPARLCPARTSRFEADRLGARSGRLRGVRPRGPSVPLRRRTPRCGD